MDSLGKAYLGIAIACVAVASACGALYLMDGDDTPRLDYTVRLEDNSGSWPPTIVWIDYIYDGDEPVYVHFEVQGWPVNESGSYSKSKISGGEGSIPLFSSKAYSDEHNIKVKVKGPVKATQHYARHEADASIWTMSTWPS